MDEKLGILLFLLGMVGTAFPPAAFAAGSIAMPPGEADAKAVLNKSPRHHEWIDIVIPGKSAPVTAFIAYPERKDKAPVVIVIHEVYGLTDWIRSVADTLAGAGIIAIAPDMLSGKGPGGGGTDKFAGRDDVVKAVRELAPAEVTAILDATARYGTKLPAAKNKFAVIGFCWGGSQSFQYAVTQPELSAAVVYYGTSPDLEALKNVKAPVIGLYGEDDARVNATVGPAEAKMKELKKTYITHTYKGAGHGFLRAQDGRDGANLEASKQAWPATIDFLKKYAE
jgi:carboxymethylenebutenolidase